MGSGYENDMPGCDGVLNDASKVSGRNASGAIWKPFTGELRGLASMLRINGNTRCPPHIFSEFSAIWEKNVAAFGRVLVEFEQLE